MHILYLGGFMDIRQLQVFCHVVNFGGFTAAAEKLHIAQSAVSIAIKKLETELGLTLFDRAERKVQLTAEGAILFERAKLLLQQFQQTKQALQELRGGHAGTVRLGTSAMLGSYYLPDKIAAFRQLYPDIKFQVNGEGTNRAQSQLLNGEIELAMVNLVDVPAELEVRHLVTEPIVACAATGHPLAKKRQVEFAAFAKYPLAVYGEGYYLRELINNYSDKAGIEPNIVLETNILRLMMGAIQKKQAVGFVLARVIAQESGLRAIKFKQPLELKLGIAWRRGHYLSVANRAFVDFLVSSGGEENRSG